MPDTDELISPGEAALLLRVSARTVARWADAGKLGEVTDTVGGHRRLSRAAVEAFIAYRQTGITYDTKVKASNGR